MYQVTVRISATDPSKPTIKFKRVTHKGVYLPRGNHGKMQHEAIKQDVENQMRTKFQNSNPSLDFKFVITVEKISCDFCFNQATN